MGVAITWQVNGTQVIENSYQKIDVQRSIFDVLMAKARSWYGKQCQFILQYKYHNISDFPQSRQSP